MYLNQENNIKFASKNDVCQLCVNREFREANKKNKKSYFEVVRDLKGKLSNQKVFYLTVSGNKIIVCKKCLEDALRRINTNIYEKKEVEDIDKFLEKGDNINE